MAARASGNGSRIHPVPLERIPYVGHVDHPPLPWQWTTLVTET